MTKTPHRKRAHEAVKAKTGKADLEAKRIKRRERLHQRLEARAELVADLRDQCVGEALTSGLTDQQIHERGGPTPQTLQKWRKRQTRLPQLATTRMLLRAIGKDLAIVDYVVGGHG